MILGTSDLKKSFGGNNAVNGVNIKIPKNKITSIIGPNGSGKSTLFNLITGLLKADAGKVILQGSDLTKKEDFEITKKEISRTFQEIRTFSYLTLREHLKLALSDNDTGIIRNFFTPQKFYDEQLKEYLDLVGLEQPLSVRGEELSYGQSKLLSLAMNLAKKHEILMLDEPVAGINPKLRAKIEKIILNLKERGETILLIEHDMNFVMDLSDLIIVMDQGQVILEGDKEAILSNKKVLKAYLGR